VQPVSRTRLALAVALILVTMSAPQASQRTPSKIGAGASKAASESCAAKIKKLDVAAAAKKKQTTQFTQDEMNSYLAIELSSKYHPSLKSLVMKFEDDNRLQGVAVIDFDELSMRAKGGLTRLLAQLLSGTHTLTMRGTLQTKAGQGHFVLESATFDDTTLPNFLVEEIISSVGRKQKPPFDPLEPSTMPYRIDHVDVHSGYIVVHQ